MDITVILVFVLAFLLAALFLRKKQNLPPGYNGIPFIGSVSFIRKLKGKRPHIVMFEESKKLGRIFRFYFGQQIVIVLSGYDIIHEALVNQKETFSDRFKFHNRVLKNLSINSDDFKDQGILTKSYGTAWRESRRFTLQALRDFGVGKSSLEAKVDEELNAAFTYFDALAGKPTEVRDLTQKIVANVIFSIVFGRRYEFDDPEFDRVRGLTNTAVTGAGPVNPNNFLPRIIGMILNRNANKIDEMRSKSFKDMREFVYKEIEEHESSYDEHNIRDFIDLFIQTSKTEDGELKKFITKNNMFRIIFDLFLAGSETTSTTLDWALLYMIEFPDVQKRYREEIEKMIGDKPVEYSDRNKLTYANAVIMEVQRLSSIVPLNVPHSTTKDTTLDGYDIPKGALILPVLYSTSMDEKYFPNPTKFDPDRYIDAKGNLIKNEAVIPFSTGPRVCIGEPLARMELFMVLTSLLQKYTFEREDPNVRHTLEARQDQITNSPLPYKLRATRIQ